MFILAYEGENDKVEQNLAHAEIGKGTGMGDSVEFGRGGQLEPQIHCEHKAGYRGKET